MSGEEATREGWRVPSALRRGGLAIALTQAALPVANIFIEPDVAVSLPLLALAAAMMGLGEAVKRDRQRQE